ncbi:hypothetical protein EVG20_g2486 [Dentipellis fragilis]|uniref:Carboxylesterase type B domain-containing protein n=1 Tax=Dentipellis fragilis TaxID=205917 RepID=A0A4Y9Z8R4_9AGAM|nr:hypothetical protein EVG20_g2486 [Dentipellis fragilis]
MQHVSDQSDGHAKSSVPDACQRQSLTASSDLSNQPHDPCAFSRVGDQRFGAESASQPHPPQLPSRETSAPLIPWDPSSFIVPSYASSRSSIPALPSQAPSILVPRFASPRAFPSFPPTTNFAPWPSVANAASTDPSQMNTVVASTVSRPVPSPPQGPLSWEHARRPAVSSFPGSKLKAFASLLNVDNDSNTTAQPLFDFFAEAAGCGSGSVTDQLSCLRQASVSALARAQDSASYGSFDGPYNAFRPVQDGKLITGRPTTALMNGQFTHVPLIVGSTSNETLSEGTDIRSALQAFFPSLSNFSLSQYLEAYPASDFDNDDQRFQVATGESELICGVRVSSIYQSQSSAYANSPGIIAGGDGCGCGATQPDVHVPLQSAEPDKPQPHRGLPFGRELDDVPGLQFRVQWFRAVLAYDANPGYLCRRAHRELVVFRAFGMPPKHVQTPPRSPTWALYASGSKVHIVLQQGPANSTTMSGSFVEAEPEKERERCQFVASKVNEEEI